MNLKNYLNVPSDKPPVVFVTGPTASGKSDIAVELAQENNAEIISADSMQIYKEMDIGTAKIKEEEKKGIPHYMIDIVDPDIDYSVSDYTLKATEHIKDILDRGKLPIVCGGTGLYINALSLPFNLDFPSTDLNLRKTLEEQAKVDPLALYKDLKRIDPESAEKIHPNNIKRVIRALEIFYVTGETKSSLDKKARQKSLDYYPILLAKNISREVLYDRINQRVDLMVKEGLLEEVKELEQKYGRNHTSMQAIGYKEFFDYFDNKIDLDEAIRILKRDTRHFAKRQLTWFRKDKRIKYFD